MEDNLWWKTIFDGRWPLMEDSLWWKTTFDRRHLLWKTFYQHDYLKQLKLDNDNKKFKVNEIKKLSKGLAFPVILDLDLKPFSKLTFAHQVLPYLEQTFTWNSSVAQLSLACFQLLTMSSKTCFGQKFSTPKIFRPPKKNLNQKIFSTQKFSWTKNLFDQIFFFSPK